MAARCEALSETVLEARKHEDGSHQRARQRGLLAYRSHETRHMSQVSQRLRIMHLIMQPQWSVTSSTLCSQHSNS
jgi:hypothetical protein